jgi:hypothetical protein
MNSEAELIDEPKQTSAQSTFTEEIFTEVCERMACGKSLREICSDPQMPSRSTFLRWVENDTGRQAKYQKARETLMDWYADEILSIAFDDKGDIISEGGKLMGNHAAVRRAEVKIRALQWTMSKLYPKRYGDKTELLALAAPDTAAPGQMAIKWKDSVHVIVYPMLGDDGRIIPTDSPEYDAAIEKAANEARARGEKNVTIGYDLKDSQPKAPAQITYQPEPLPGGLSEDDWSLMSDVLRLIKQTIPTDDTSAPEAIFRILREALLLHFREVTIETAA